MNHFFSGACSTALSIVMIGGFILASASAASAGMVSGWWGGNWRCTIDGRPAQMRWVPVSVDNTNCDGDTCSTSSGALWKGSFSDNGSRWVPLTSPRTGSQGGVFFRHADGNQWYLPQPAGNRSNGWTTWQGRRYPLSCWR